MDVGRGVHRSLVNKNTLLYYRTEQDANNHPRGQIELSAAITVEVCARPLSASAQLATGPPARSHRFVERSWLGSYSAPSVQWTLLTPVDAINQCRSNPVFHRRVSYLLWSGAGGGNEARAVLDVRAGGPHGRLAAAHEHAEQARRRAVGGLLQAGGLHH